MKILLMILVQMASKFAEAKDMSITKPQKFC